MRDEVCRYCKRSPARIDYYGEELIGCVDCNRWAHPGDKNLVMKLKQKDLEALKTFMTKWRRSLS